MHKSLRQYTKQMRRWLADGYAWLLPGHCIYCQTEIRSAELELCPECYLKLPFQHHCCVQCGQLIGARSDYCGRCIEKPPSYDACFCPFRYEFPVDDCIRKFKYSEHPQMSKILSQLLFDEIQNQDLPLPDLLIPVPLHLSKLRNRGFNQAWQITQHLSHLSGIPCCNKILVKKKSTPPQASLSVPQRRRNIRGCFRVIRPIKEKHVAIIDDVVTTGSTADEIAKILKRNGVNYVQVWGIAHTI